MDDTYVLDDDTRLDIEAQRIAEAEEQRDAIAAKDNVDHDPTTGERYDVDAGLDVEAARLADAEDTAEQVQRDAYVEGETDTEGFNMLEPDESDSTVDGNRTATTAKKTAAKKTTARKRTAKKATAKKTAAKKTAAKKG